MEALSPAPASTATCPPSAMNFFAVPGVAAPRRSPSAISLRTASFMSEASVGDDEDDEHADDEAQQGAPLHHRYESRIALPMDRDFLVELAFGSHVHPFISNAGRHP